MLLGDNKKQIKLFILNDNQQWQEYVKATLYLDIIQNSCCLRLVLKQPLLPAQLALLPQKNLFNPIDSTIHIEMDRISKLQRMGPLVFALQIEEQKRIFALSFRDALYSDIIFQQLELNEGSTSKLPCKEDELIEYIAGQVATNPGFVEMFFNCDQVIEAFMKQAKQYENQPDSKHKRVVFKTIKQLFLRTDRKIIKLLLKDNRYRQLLLCLSYNYQFGDRTIPYHQQYQKTIAVTNLLQISDNNILQKYHDNIKIRFLIHVATSMFIQPFIESVLLQMIDFNSIDILQFLVKNPENLIKANKLAQTDPCSYLLLFSQLWQMFRFISQDARSIPLKRAFKDLFISQNMLNLAFQSALAVTKNSNSNNRIYQQFLQALNPCLSHKWNQSQQLLLFLYEQKKVHLLQVLINILKVADYNTKVIVLLFAKNLIEITQNRPKMKQNFYNYYFNQFVTLCIPYFQTIEQLQILVDYLMKLYNFDLFRTRRAIIESQLLPQLQSKMHNKYVLILVLKLFRYFVSFSNDGIFGYLKKHKLFEGLRQKYYQTKKYNPNGVVNSLFVGLLRDLQKTENSFGLRYLYQVLCHPNNNK